MNPKPLAWVANRIALSALLAGTAANALAATTLTAGAGTQDACPDCPGGRQNGIAPE